LAKGLVLRPDSGDPVACVLQVRTTLSHFLCFCLHARMLRFMTEAAHEKH
jgi:hypothetical protein